MKIGINKENELKAVELILKYVSDYKPEALKEVKQINKTALKLFIISLFIFLVSLIRPRTIVGLGKNSFKLKFYKAYTKIVLITIPTVFVLTPILEWINSFLKS